ncbi:MAG: hypothetical protein H6767_01520 [Candidatus Peribacteria bacterium]|nr:MAG: hypothetical protein H6767_01520 [Candidatus Peribacteria bacterium]
MTTFTIDDTAINGTYTADEMKLKFLDFLRRDLSEDAISMYEVSVEDLPKGVKTSYDQIDTMEFSKV